ncbi:MAG: 50S ribosomal protein L18 [Candidatus Bathyarchaeia archaeon]
MAHGSTYNLPFRRRREGKTDYRLRRALLTSNLPRLVIRVTGKHSIAQIVEATPTGDKVLASATSIELTRDYGWKGGCGNLPAAYLTGLLAGLKAGLKNIKEAVADIGLRRVTKGSRVFTVLRGVLDSGLQIPHSQKILPEEARIKGEHIAAYAAQISSNPEEYKRRFSRYLQAGLKPEDFPEHFEQVKSSILESFKAGEAR